MATSTVDEYIKAVPTPVGEVLRAARRLILETLVDANELMKWGTPVYRLPNGEIVCYLYGGIDHVNLGFLFGARLDDPAGLLEGAGQKDSRHIRLDSSDLPHKAAMIRFLKDSAELAS